MLVKYGYQEKERNEMYMDIGGKIKEFRVKNKLTQEELAEKLGVTSQAVSRWECGLSLPDVSMIPLISKVLFVSADELLGCGSYSVPNHELCKDLDCSGEILTQSQIDSIFEGCDMVPDGISKKILVIDDAPFMRMMLEDIFTKSGHTVLQAENGEMALRMLEEEKVDLCTLDIMMPGMNGMDVLKQICADMPEVKVMMISAMSQRSIVEEALRTGAAAFVAKPFQVDSITKRVGQIK